MDQLWKIAIVAILAGAAVEIFASAVSSPRANHAPCIPTSASIARSGEIIVVCERGDIYRIDKSMVWHEVSSSFVEGY